MCEEWQMHRGDHDGRLIGLFTMMPMRTMMTMMDVLLGYSPGGRPG